MSVLNKRQSGSTTRGASLRHWMALTEASTRSWAPGDIKQARRVFDHLLTPAEQMSVVREVVETRATELVRAYRNIIDVGFGFRRRRRRRSGEYQIVTTPCVHFVVKRKWAAGTEESPEGKIPERLFAYCWIGRERRLCAVPTDVEDARAFAMALPQTDNIEVTFREASVRGAVACGLQRGDDQKAFALSCRHLLSLSDVYGTEPTWGASVTVEAAGAQTYLGKTRAIAGTLQEAPAPSFDAQLLEVTSLDALRFALDGIQLSSYTAGYLDLPHRFSIHTPRGEVGASFFGFRYDSPLYTLRQIGYISHTMLIVSVPDTPTEPGDSGSPVVSQKQDGVLVGMHIAGVDNGEGNRFAYMIPAWQLFDPANYNGAANSEKWTILNP
jgi:hypothetical protein